MSIESIQVKGKSKIIGAKPKIVSIHRILRTRRKWISQNQLPVLKLSSFRRKSQPNPYPIFNFTDHRENLLEALHATPELLEVHANQNRQRSNGNKIRLLVEDRKRPVRIAPKYADANEVSHFHG